ncbi:hypothetical protein ABIC37_005924 [Priestia megaterium]|jgi:hypothetical protein|uniref:hypothetical protein n=1 Tax=Priestia megaterium TaxID=1404 RepID=UPI0010D3F1EB|nr:hypothetical protein [Priestia megaterium]TCN05941.1 hypothetical protein EV581_11161 [Bacillus sp. BK006]
MWIITTYSNLNNTTMFEYENEIEARKAFKEIQGCKILSEVIYFRDSKLALDVY